ncbi:DNA primase [Candidatus Saccharibacteria bacterium]|nr:DNA primase [Candidatus Saccharibacteria bacterium]
MNEVEEVKNRLDIVEVIGSYVPLKQTGRNFKGLSPFKSEKTPSFIVSPEKSIWHDFSSDQGGDVISFVMLMEGLEFRDALEMLARRAGVTLKLRSAAQARNVGKKARLYEALELAMKYYHLCLSRNEHARSYFVKERGLGAATLKQYKLGYSPDSWDSLTNFLVKRGFTNGELKEAGLVSSKAGGKSVFDSFRGRVMFPVFDSQGRVVGFSARLLGEAKAAKYINTPQTLVYDKSTAIYGLYQAKESIRNTDSVVIVEGNVDVLALANAGYGNAVASSGTALTTQQLKTLSYLTHNVYICFDSDSAGIAATQRTIELAQGMDIRLRVIELKGAKDPDELVSKNKQAWAEAVQKALYAPDYLLKWAKANFNYKTALGKKQLAKFLLPMLGGFEDEVERDHYIKTIAQTLDVGENSLREQLNKTNSDPKQPKAQVGQNTPQPIRERKLTRQEKLERELAELLLARPETREVLIDIEPTKITELFRPYFEALIKKPKLTSADLEKQLQDRANYGKILMLRGEQTYSDLSEHDVRVEAHSQVLRLQNLQTQLNKRSLSKALAEAEAAHDQTKAQKILKKYQALLNEE